MTRLILLLTLIAIVVVLFPDATPCLDHDGNGRWGYRVIDDRKCWFQLDRGEHRGRDRDRAELFWERDPPMQTNQTPWELEGRWRVPPRGWDHQE